MGDFLEKLAADRRDVLTVLETKGRGINLDIFDDFYPDKAHFVFELLQNAEDAGAKAVIFTLLQAGCWFEHDGDKSFTEDDVFAIVSIHDSTKSKSIDKIGKFGIGFKSVFLYTNTPTIYSADFSFQILKYILPELVAPDKTIGIRTKFWLPFNSEKMLPEQAFKEISEGLNEIAETSLLFLPKIKSIKWTIGDSTTGEILREEHSPYHIEVLKDVSGEEITSSHFLRFNQTVEGLESQSVSVAFALAPLQTEAALFENASIAKRFKIVPVEGQVAVYFPAKKETSKLRFHLHAPFIPELSRASIKATKENQSLFDQLAKLSASALYHIRDLGLLTAEFLGVLPNPQDALVVGSGYAAIRDAIVDEIKNEPLCPTFDKKHAPAKRLLQAGGNLKELLNEDDLEFLVEYNGEPPLWAAPRALQGTKVEKFMSGLGIRTWDTPQFQAALVSNLDGSPFRQINPIYLRWLKSKDTGWHRKFYRLIDQDQSMKAQIHTLARCNLVKQGDGSYGLGRDCHFQSLDESPVPGLSYAHPALYHNGDNEAQTLSVRNGLRSLGVTEVEKKDRILALLESKYGEQEGTFDEAAHIADIREFMTLEAGERQMLSAYAILYGSDGQRHISQALTISETLLEYYELSDGPTSNWLLASFYEKYRDRIGTPDEISRWFGLPDLIRVAQGWISGNPARDYLHSVKGEARGYFKANDYVIEHVEKLAGKKSPELSKLLWQTLERKTPPHTRSDDAETENVLRAFKRNTLHHGAHFADSQLVCHLREAAWVPQTDGRFVKPADASVELLPSGFNFNAQRPWIKAVKFGEDLKTRQASQSPDALKQAQDEAAKTLGLDRDTAIQLGEVPKEELRDFLANRKPRLPIQLPERKSNNPARRQLKVREAALNAPERQTEGRMRSVSVGAAEVKSEAREYLRSHYTNNDGLQVCQICQDELPFKKANGEYYFECIEVFDKSETLRHHDANYLCLCPNHAAMFEHANPAKAEFQRSMVEERETKIPINLADMDFRVYFTEDHLSDIRAVMGVESEVG